MKKTLDLKGFAIGGTFLLIMSGLGSWLYGLPFWLALLIGFGCMVILGLVTVFENGDQKQSDKGPGPQ